MRYLRPDLLDAAGVADFDAWRPPSARPCRRSSSDPTAGSGSSPGSPSSATCPRLLRMWLVAGDVKTAEDLNLAVPRSGPAAPTAPAPPRRSWSRPPPNWSTSSPPSPTGPRRCAAARSTPTKTTCSRSPPTAAPPRWTCGWSDSRHRLPARANSPSPPRRSSGIWEAHRDDVYLDSPAGRTRVPGALQIVFCDLGTPNATRWNAYDELRDLLAAGGVPREQIRFIHEAGTDQEKAELFAACRDGRVAVLHRLDREDGRGHQRPGPAVALHHLDCPWRPADLDQREGRIIRQGNQNTEVAVFRYVTEGTFDGYMWQTVTRKADLHRPGHARQPRRPRDRRHRRPGPPTPRSRPSPPATRCILDKAQADADLTRLERLKRAHDQTRSRLRDTIRRHERSIEQLTAENDTLQHAIEQRTDTRGDAFTCVVRPRDQRPRVHRVHRAGRGR